MWNVRFVYFASKCSLNRIASSCGMMKTSRIDSSVDVHYQVADHVDFQNVFVEVCHENNVVLDVSFRRDRKDNGHDIRLHGGAVSYSASKPGMRLLSELSKFLRSDR